MDRSTLANFSCPECAVKTPLRISPPFHFGCPNCCSVFSISNEKGISLTGLRVKKFESLNPILLGASGNFANASFTLIGHLRKIDSNSISNEWLMYFDNGDIKWLVEDCFSYFVFEPERIPIPKQSIQSKKIGNKLSILGNDYVINQLAKHIEMQMEGQIPNEYLKEEPQFKFMALSYDAKYYFSIDVYSKDLIQGYKGSAVDLESLNLSCLTASKDWM